MEDRLEHPETVRTMASEEEKDDWGGGTHWYFYDNCLLFLHLQGEMVQWTVFLISYWGDQIGQKVKKICDWWVKVFLLYRIAVTPKCLDPV